MEDTTARIVNQLTSRHPCTLNESSFYSRENERWFWNGEGALGCRQPWWCLGWWYGAILLAEPGCLYGEWQWWGDGYFFIGKGMEAAGWNGLGLTLLLQHLLKVSQFTRVRSLLWTLREPNFIYGNERWCWKEQAMWGRMLSMGVGRVAGW